MPSTESLDRVERWMAKVAPDHKPRVSRHENTHKVYGRLCGFLAYRGIKLTKPQKMAIIDYLDNGLRTGELSENAGRARNIKRDFALMLDKGILPDLPV